MPKDWGQNWKTCYIPKLHCSSMNKLSGIAIVIVVVGVAALFALSPYFTESTIDEAKAYGTPGIFIPIKGHFEQETNAKTEGFNFDDIFNLEYLIDKKLGVDRKLSRYDGANKAYEIIKSTLSI